MCARRKYDVCASPWSSWLVIQRKGLAVSRTGTRDGGRELGKDSKNLRYGHGNSSTEEGGDTVWMRTREDPYEVDSHQSAQRRVGRRCRPEVEGPYASGWTAFLFSWNCAARRISSELRGTHYSSEWTLPLAAPSSSNNLKGRNPGRRVEPLSRPRPLGPTDR
ncbi:hypothetical protein DFH06DRAFT_522042 [Mycena polygramma]|nr:hypothetical protein DFH06DRAFT_522042 [Mycena polygramma]